MPSLQPLESTAPARARRRFGRRVVVPVVSLLVAVPALIGLRSARDIPAGTGYSALELCTRTSVIGEPYARVRTVYVEPKVQPLPRIWSVEYTPRGRVAVSSVLPLLGNPRSAVFRPGLGCTVVPPGTTEAAVLAQPFHAAPEAPVATGPWPFG